MIIYSFIFFKRNISFIFRGSPTQCECSPLHLREQNMKTSCHCAFTSRRVVFVCCVLEHMMFFLCSAPACSFFPDLSPFVTTLSLFICDLAANTIVHSVKQLRGLFLPHICLLKSIYLRVYIITVGDNNVRL